MTSGRYRSCAEPIWGLYHHCGAFQGGLGDYGEVLHADRGRFAFPTRPRSTAARWVTPSCHRSTPPLGVPAGLEASNLTAAATHVGSPEGNRGLGGFGGFGEYDSQDQLNLSSGRRSFYTFVLWHRGRWRPDTLPDLAQRNPPNSPNAPNPPNPPCSCSQPARLAHCGRGHAAGRRSAQVTRRRTNHSNLAPSLFNIISESKLYSFTSLGRPSRSLN